MRKGNNGASEILQALRAKVYCAKKKVSNAKDFNFAFIVSVQLQPQPGLHDHV